MEKGEDENGGGISSPHPECKLWGYGGSSPWACGSVWVGRNLGPYDLVLGANERRGAHRLHILHLASSSSPAHPRRNTQSFWGSTHGSGAWICEVAPGGSRCS